MRLLKLPLLLVAIACLLYASAEAKDNYDEVLRVEAHPCELVSVVYDWDFSVSDHGFTPAICAGGLPVWQWGAEAVIPGAPANVWATVLNGNYPNLAGESLIAPAFTVTPDASLMEVWHFVHIETNWDGGNVKVNGQIIEPMVAGGYTHTMNSAPVCVAGQRGWSGFGWEGPSQVWLQQCFDLSDYMGQEIVVQFDFGSDSSVMYPGWYLGYVKVGNDDVTPSDSPSWGEIKSNFR